MARKQYPPTPSLRRAWLSHKPFAGGAMVGVCCVLFFSIGLTPPVYSAFPGDLDRTFSGDGKVIIAFQDGSSDEAFGVVIQPDSKIVVVGDSLHFSRADDFAVARYNDDGKLDTTFGKKGLVLTDFKGHFRIPQSDQAGAVALQKDGKIVVAGVTGSGSFAEGSFALEVASLRQVITAWEHAGK